MTNEKFRVVDGTRELIPNQVPAMVLHESLSPGSACGLQSHQPNYQQTSAAFRDVSRVLDEVDVTINEDIAQPGMRAV